MLASMSEGSDPDDAAAAALGMQMIGFQFRMDAGYYGMLAALVLGAGACMTPIYRSFTEGGTRMTLAMLTWFVAGLLGAYAFFQWTDKPLGEEGLEKMLEQQLEEGFSGMDGGVFPGGLDSTEGTTPPVISLLPTPDGEREDSETPVPAPEIE